MVDAIEHARPRLGRLATSVLHVPTIASTNDAALASNVEGAIVIADAQTAGRGRRGHVWFSPPLSGLYVSVVLAPGRHAADFKRATSLLTLTIGVALAEGVEASTGLHADLKWPNDVYIRSRKLAGILAESNGQSVVAGYGINLAADAYPPELQDRVTSLESEVGRRIDRSVVLVETLAAIAARDHDLLAGKFDAILDAWRRRAPTAAGARVEWTMAVAIKHGITDGIDDDGALRVRTDAGPERIVGGEVRWVDLGRS